MLLPLVPPLELDPLVDLVLAAAVDLDLPLFTGQLQLARSVAISTQAYATQDSRRLERLANLVCLLPTEFSSLVLLACGKLSLLHLPPMDGCKTILTAV